MTPPFCHLVHTEWYFIQGKFGYLADRNNLFTFALVIGKRWKRKNRGTKKMKYNPFLYIIRYEEDYDFVDDGSNCHHNQFCKE